MGLIPWSSAPIWIADFRRFYLLYSPSSFLSIGKACGNCSKNRRNEEFKAEIKSVEKGKNWSVFIFNQTFKLNCYITIL
jgi:hypothetical protein